MSKLLSAWLGFVAGCLLTMLVAEFVEIPRVYNRCFDITRRLRECAATTIREVAQPIADERDEYREALTNLVYDIAGEQHDFDEISKAFCPIVATRIQYARAILAKYQKQPNNEHA